MLYLKIIFYAIGLARNYNILIHSDNAIYFVSVYTLRTDNQGRSKFLSSKFAHMSIIQWVTATSCSPANMDAPFVVSRCSRPLSSATVAAASAFPGVASRYLWLMRSSSQHSCVEAPYDSDVVVGGRRRPGRSRSRIVPKWARWKRTHEHTSHRPR